jgi:hypothetical protein
MLDRKHVHIVVPLDSCSLYCNYKETFSNALLALVDAYYDFIFIDIGKSGSLSDGGVFKRDLK